jgi:transcription initiation factor TFIIIB Brf1 subunit/transcription initiation factor TFIIB
MNEKNELESPICTHQNLMQDGPYIVCKDCGLIVDEGLEFETSSSASFYSDSQQAYERKIRVGDSRATQDPKIKQKYEKLKTLDKWFRDYHTNFSEQKKTIDLLKSYGVGLNIDNVKYQHIKEKYLRYNKYHRQTYQNMIIIFLAIVWMEIKDTTNIRVEEFIAASRELGHKINKKMLNNAMEKIARTETNLDDKTALSISQLEREIKKKIKILFQKDMNNISFEEVKEYITNQEEFNKLKIDMQLIADRILKSIPYRYLQNLNYKAFTAGLIYYIGQTLENPKIFTQSLVEKTSRFSSTTIRKKFHILKDLLGDPTELDV